MSTGSEAVLTQYPNHGSTQYHEVSPPPAMNGETSSTTSSEAESQYAPPLKGGGGGKQNGPVIVPVVENGPDVYQSDSSVDSGQSQPVSTVGHTYINGPIMTSLGYQGCDFEPRMEGAPIGYTIPLPEYDGNQNLEYPTTQEFLPPEMYNHIGGGNEYIDYQQQQIIGQVGDDSGHSPNSTGSSPHSTNPGEKQKYVFYLHIKQGEAFPVENGDQVRYIHGPTIIQLVSPSPNPPSIHMVQTGLGVGTPIHQAPMPPNTMHMGGPPPPPPPMQPEPEPGVPPTVYNTGTGTVPIYQPMYHPQPPPGPGGGVGYAPLPAFPNTAMQPPHMHGPGPQGNQMPPPGLGGGGGGGGGGHIHHHPPHVHIQRFPPAGNSSHPSQHHAHNMDHSNRHHEQGHRPLLPRSRSRDDRTEKQREKLQRKLMDRRKENGGGYISSPQISPRGHSSSSSRGSSTSPRDNRSTSHRPTENGTGGRGGPRRKRHSSSSPRNGDAEDNRRITEILSTLTRPDVIDIASRSAFVKWSAPILPQSPDEVDDRFMRAGFRYEMQLSEKGKGGGNMKSFQSHDPSWHLADLKPGTEYYLSVCAISDNVKGSPSEPAFFSTLGCPPDIPSPPILVNRTKNSLLLKWHPPCTNGSRIHTYILQYDKGDRDSKSGFHTVFDGLEKQFKVTRLQPSTCYRFRLQAANSHGASGYSNEARIFTSGSVPAAQDPPSLSESTAHSLKLHWKTCAGDVSGYLLEMEEKYGFQPAYRGEETTYTCTCLARNSEYKFRLCAFNDEGSGRWSSVVAFRTKPDTPRAPQRPALKGKIHSNSFRVTWEPPRDTGGAEITSYLLELSEASDGGFQEVYRGMEKEHVCNDLRPGTLYEVRVSCSSRGGTSSYSEVCSLTTLPVCPGQCPPPRLHGRPKAVSLNLRWSSPEYDGGSPVTEYLVVMTAADPDSTPQEVHRGPTEIMECSVNNLLAGKVYSFKVQASNKLGAGPFSETLQITTGAGPPDRPEDLTALFKSPTSACVGWGTPSHNGAEVTEYKLEKASESGVFGLAYTGPSTSCELRSLRPATYYYLRVQAINAAGPGLFSDVTTCMTPSSSPEVVPLLRVISSTSDSLLLKWTEPNNCGEDILAYNIDIGKDQTIVVEGNATEYCIDQLEADTKYRIRIQAVNNKGAGPYSATLKATTQALPPAPPRLECSLFGHQSLKLKWVDVTKVVSLDGKSLNYCLEMEDRKGKYSIVYAGINTSHKVSRLSENTIYKFRICASNEAGNGPYSEEYSFSTLKAPPAVLKAPSITDVTETSVVLKWATLPPLLEDKIVYQCQCLKGRDNNDNKQIIYRGEDSTYSVLSLEPNTEYGFRVCAVRVPSDSPELVGVYSPWGMVQTHSNRRREDQTDGGEGGPHSQRGLQERAPLGDQQIAALIMSCFLVGAILIAVILQYLVS